MLVAAVAPAAERPAARHRAFWEASLGPVWSDNVYRDRSQEGGAGYDLGLRLGLRSRHSPRTFSELRYELDAGGFRRANIENRTDHGLAGLFRRRLGEGLSVELQLGARWSRFPNVPVFDSRAYLAQVGLRGYLASRTTLEGGLTLDSRSYPSYDLDNRSVGLFAKLGHELGRRTTAELVTVLERTRYSERRVLAASEPDQLAGELRRDRDWLAGVRLVRDVRTTLRLELGYEHGRQGANGDFMDFGPFQSEELNDIPGDERIVGDYYSHRRHELRLRARKLVRRGLYLTFACRYQDRAYEGRLAKDEQERFLVPDELRHDRGLLLSAVADLPLPGLPRSARFGHFGLRVRAVRQVHRSNDALYDYGHTALALALTSWH